MWQLAEDLYVLRDTCNVYVIRDGTDAVLIDFGSGAVLDRLAELGVDRVTDILMTHHHRDQAQGLARAEAAGIRVWVPPVEYDLFAAVDEHWRTRQLDNDYNLREDRFSLFSSIEPAGVVAEYRSRAYGGVTAYALPTPGHTVGSVTYLVERGGRRLAFSGDLIYAPGRVWSLAALQWTYSGDEGLAATILSCRELADAEPDLLLPAHGKPIDEPRTALDRLVERLAEVETMRRCGDRWDLDARRDEPWEPVTPHLLRNRSSFATTYALLSESGSALFFDFGYDMTTGLPAGADRAARRPLLSSLRALRRDYGVDRVEVAVPTHYHDDHVAGFNLLREVEGARVWSAEGVAPVLRRPKAYDLPCLWYDPIPVEREVPAGRPIRWREYELTMYDLPGHTLYATAIAVRVDGHRVVVSGDQQDGGWRPGERRELLNYQYRNGFRYDDFVRSAELYQRLAPELMVSGHWAPRWVEDGYLDMLADEGRRIADLHRQLLPLEEVDFGRFGSAARIAPYRCEVAAGSRFTLTVTVGNPLPAGDEVRVALVVPEGFEVDEPVRRFRLEPRRDTPVRYAIRAPWTGPRIRERVGADVTVGSVPFGLQAEALVDVPDPRQR